MATKDALRSLKIKTGVVERTLKELQSYQKELEDNKEQISRIRESNDHSKLKQWENVLGETQNMVPDTSARLSQAVEELHTLLESVDGVEGSGDSSEVKQARAAIAEAASSVTK